MAQPCRQPFPFAENMASSMIHLPHILSGRGHMPLWWWWRAGGTTTIRGILLPSQPASQTNPFIVEFNNECQKVITLSGGFVSIRPRNYTSNWIYRVDPPFPVCFELSPHLFIANLMFVRRRASSADLVSNSLLYQLLQHVGMYICVLRIATNWIGQCLVWQSK